ncbi:MAG: GDSL-type esterase/lipase family protein [Bacteroidales bacterium]|nr:GDSL-type esterase/lipase family protein [Bacteroidales bacterium]MDZ4204868.1 GDSL-type esterase/lipase family protein [Bacteroidales bacterium]
MKRQNHILFLLMTLLFFKGFARDKEYPFASEIRRFNEIDKVNPPPRHAILFIGSSSFTMWQDLQNYFPEFKIINRAFGGSTLDDQLRYARDIVLPYTPRQVVIYCGENDLAFSDTITPEIVVQRFIALFNLIRTGLPDTQITYISMKPSPSRWYLAEKFNDANQGIRIFMEYSSNAGFVNIWDDMLNENYIPDTTLFLEDMLHMNEKGYNIWQKAISPELVD